MKKVFVLMMVFVMVLGFTIMVGAQENPDPVTLEVRLFNDAPVHMDEVLQEFYSRTEDSLNTKLNIEWNPGADHEQLILLAATSGEELDLVFDAPWMNINKLAKDGFYRPLDKYFNNDEYPGLKATFSEDYLNNNKFFGKIYGIPLTQSLDSIEGITIRKDLMDKYGFEEIKTYDKLQEFFDVILENEPDITPFNVAESYFRMFPRYTEEQNIFKITDGWVGNIYAQFNDDFTEVTGVYVDGDPEEYIEDFNAPWNTKEAWYEKFNKYREWSKYIVDDPLAEAVDSTEADFAAFNRGMLNLQHVKDVKTFVPEARDYDVPVYTFPYRKGDRLRIADSKYITYQVWNFIGVPVTSQDPDRVMKFIDWIFQNRENHDLFEYGIEGEHWIATGGDKFKYPEDLDQPYVFPWYQLTGHPDMVRYNEDYPQDWIDLNEWASTEKRNVLSPLAGFQFDYEPVRMYKASVDAIYTRVEKGLMTGQYENPVEILEQANEEARATGLNKIREELKKQLQEFLDAKK